MKFNEIDFSLKNILIVLSGLFLITLIYAARDIFLLFIVSVFIAYLINPAVEFFTKLRLPRIVGVLIIVFILVLLLVVLIAILVPALIKDVTIIVKNMPEYVNTVFSWIEKLQKYFNIEANIDLESSKAFLLERIGVISKYILNTLSSAAFAAKGLAGILINIFMVPVLVFFLLIDFPSFKQYTGRLVERFSMQKIMEHLSQFETLVGKYFRGMFLVGIILSILYGAVLYFVGTKGWLFLGILTGFGAMIPYIGFAVGLTTSLIVTALTFHDIMPVLYMLGGFIIVQVLESMVITPKIVGDSLGISPVVVIIALMLGGAFGGFLGMIVALPLAAFVKILIDQYVFKKRPNNNPEVNEKNTKDNEIEK